jgi:predicted nucleic acid-binding protein
MRKTIVSYTSCVILFTNFGELELLYHLYVEFITTLEIAIEIWRNFTRLGGNKKSKR